MRPIARNIVPGVLAVAVVLIAVNGVLRDSDECSRTLPRARSDMDCLEKALALFRLEHRRYPTTEEGLVRLTRPTVRYPSGFVESLPETDPWGRPYVYESDGREYRISCLGADGVPGGDGEDADFTTDLP